MLRTKAFIGRCRPVEEFKRIDTIGEGSYGLVYSARDTQDNELVALKRIKLTSDRDGMPLTALREIRLLNLVKEHPNVVRLKEIVVGDKLSSVYLVFEYAEHDMGELVQKSKDNPNPPVKFTEPQIKCLMKQILSAVAYLHKREIIHRDLKMSNLLYSKGCVKLADFGLARIQNTKVPNSIFETGQEAGDMSPKVVTLWYRPPELLLGEKRYDGKKVDMWACGCIFGELLKGKPMMAGRKELDQFRLITELLGAPTNSSLPGCNDLPHSSELLKNVDSNLKPKLHEEYHGYFHHDKGKPNFGMDLLSKLLDYNPRRRISAEEALEHQYFKTHPLCCPQDKMPTFESRKRVSSAP